MQWVPPAPESLQLYVQVEFARGTAPAVHGLHSFRDGQRRDIQGELPGWPAGEPFAPHVPRTEKEEKLDKRLSYAGRLVGLLLTAVTQVDGPGAGGKVGGGPEFSRQSDDPPNEVEDFPVLWADPGTVARGLPWQLDAARSGYGYQTLLAVTDQRLYILGFARRAKAPEEMLWQVPLSAVRQARQMAFSAGRTDLRIDFADGSWTRMALRSPYDMLSLIPLLRRTARRITGAEIPVPQRAGVAKAVAGFEKKKGMEPPRLILLPSGYIAAAVQAPGADDRGFTQQARFITPQGEVTHTAPDDIA